MGDQGPDFRGDRILDCALQRARSDVDTHPFDISCLAEIKFDALSIAKFLLIPLQ